MSAPTNVRVEAISPTSTVIRWAYTGTHSIGVYRSTDGVIFAITGNPVLVGTRKFTDSDLVTETKYWYKLSDDVGVSFSSVVTVHTHACGTANSDPNNTSFDRLTDKEIPVGHIKKVINDMQRKLENWIGKREMTHSDPCVGCIVDGAITFDCTECDEFEVEITEDVNSVSFLNCPNPPVVHWQCPADFSNSAGCGVCGFPANGPFSGDECTQAKIPRGRTITTGPLPPRSKPGGNTGGGGGGGGGGSCECTPGQSSTLTIKCCSGDCSMSCSSTRSLNIKVCGGKGPYTVSATGSVSIKKRDGTTVGASTEVGSGETLVITPPANSGGFPGNVAYVKRYWNGRICVDGNVTAVESLSHQDFGCDDAQIGGCFVPADGHTHCSNTPGAGSMFCMDSTAVCLPACTGLGTCGGGFTNTCDDRTGAMIAGGCNPCGVSANGKVITATDSLGNSVAKTLTL